MTILCLAIWLLFVAQTATTPTPPPGPPAVQTPSNAQERMDLAKKMNGLHGMTVPWHLKATYELFAPDGKSSDKGTYEEWWVSEKKYRIAYHSPALVVEEFGTDHGIFRTGQQPWPRSPLSAIRAMITQPVFPATISQKTTFENFQRDFGTRKLPCTAITTSGPERPIRESFFCFSPTNAVLLYASTFEGAYQTLFQDMRVVNGQHLAYTMQRFLAGNPWLTIHVETVEGLGNESLAALNVPDGASPTVKRLTEAKNPSEGNQLMKRFLPKYPVEAKERGIQGTVVLNGVINTEGHLTDVRVMAGPRMLQPAALDAVRQWIYQPYTVDGQPIEVEADISVVFALGR